MRFSFLSFFARIGSLCEIVTTVCYVNLVLILNVSFDSILVIHHLHFIKSKGTTL